MPARAATRPVRCVWSSLVISPRENVWALLSLIFLPSLVARPRMMTLHCLIRYPRKRPNLRCGLLPIICRHIVTDSVESIEAAASSPMRTGCASRSAIITTSGPARLAEDEHGVQLFGSAVPNRKRLGKQNDYEPRTAAARSRVLC